jgi:predicted TIM-barrel fold metal-dependent hydrolase
MPYADGGRTYFDADSHIMEVRDWLQEYADPDVRERLRPLNVGRGGGAAAEKAVLAAERRRGDPEAAVALEERLMTAKGWGALGAFDPMERVRALDLLGFHKQLVFPTFASTQFMGEDLELLYGGARALNRGIADFCSVDDRLVPVATVPMDDPDLAAQAIDDALEFGCQTVMIPSAPPRDKSPTHPDYDKVWARLQDADVPFQLHIGGGGRFLKPAFHNNDRPVTDHLGGGENIRSKDFMCIHFPPEIFLSVLVLDGIFEKFPRLRGGCIEQGALWVVPWLQRLDIAQASFMRTEKYLDLPEKASDYAREHLWFTPFPTEPVGWMIEQAGDDMFMFSSDYPHPEGGRDPLKRFNASLEGVSPEAMEKFYSGNFAAMMGWT